MPRPVRILETLAAFFSGEAPLAEGDCVIAAFSGGPDSTALLWGLSCVARQRGFRVVAAHVDHGLDPGAADRAAFAASLASRLGVACRVERRAVAELRRRGESGEEAARRVRYDLLELIRRDERARWIATAHHLDDQAETVLLRLAAGSGLLGLAGIRRRLGCVVRPLLDLPRAELAATLVARGLPWIADPTNADQAVPRNRLRHRVLPALEAAEPGLVPAAACLAATAERAAERLERLFAGMLPLLESPSGDAALGREDLARLPRELHPLALAWYFRRRGAGRAPRASALAELARQLAVAGRPRCDAGDGWTWRSDRGRLWLERTAPRCPPFSYTFEVPGELELPPLVAVVRVFPAAPANWMWRGERSRAALALPAGPGDRVTIRNRRPGDALQPLGAPGRRRLKELLIDRRVPAALRDRLPLLCWRDEIAWVPGITIAHELRLRPGAPIWIAEIETP